jgi:hypothetical protein
MKSDNLENFKKLVSTECTDTLKENRWRIENRGWLRKSQKISLEILEFLEKNNVSKELFATKIGCTIEEFNLMLSGSYDYSLSTLDKIEKNLA